ncbi:TonB-dependent receptor [Sphingomonas sp. IC-56]|uniref:TonB-dependent receptor n=1 Tax=Sphingomonas sp. IC-56 TaxID=2898529 RepID=UPI001E50262C|nr:TonB-dependent receptor [Sphingomonas sp. IC-56]MCD2324411.1 TonB-dependent receptor [Sphingomonas sp. IC-56]
MFDRVLRSQFASVAMVALSVAMVGGHAAPAMAQEQNFALDMRAQDLADALRDFARNTRQQVAFDARTVAGKRAPAVRGRYSTGTALELLLRGSGLRFRKAASGVIIISAPARRDAASDLEAESAPAQAPAVPVGADDNPDAPAVIVVTGTRIASGVANTPNPVVSLDRRVIEASGTTNITDVLAGYPALQGSSTSAQNSGQRALANGQTGLNLLNLRNLGAERTLVLVNGRRHVASVPGSQAVDINTIPSDLVERVDILTGGASAVYGADGVTGVVNFIMRQDFDGISARGQAGISERGDAGQRLFALTAGKNFAEGRGNIVLAYEHGEEDRLLNADRRQLSGPGKRTFFLNPDDPENAFDYAGPNDNGIPDNVPLANVRYIDSAREGGIDVDFDGMPDYLVDGTGAVLPFRSGTFVPYSFTQGGSGTLVADFGDDLLPGNRRDILSANARFEVSPALTLFAEAKVAQTKAFSLSQPTYDIYLFLPADNAFIPDAIRPLISPDIGGVLLNRDEFGLGRPDQDIRRRTYRSVVGARGAISDHARYEASYTFGRTDIRSRSRNAVLSDRFYAAIDAVTDPVTGQPTCRVNLDPSWTPDQPMAFPRVALPPTTFRPGECVPLNLFGENAASSEALNFIRQTTDDRARLEQHVATASVSGDFGQLFTLPGGAVGFAIGAEYRKESSRYAPDAQKVGGNTFGGVVTANRGAFDVKEAFAELRAPLLKDVPFADRLEFGAALRVSDYSTIGTATTWKVDGLYSPIRDIALTGTYSVAIRAPNVGELFAGQSQTSAAIADPCNANEIQNGTANRAANCATLLQSLGVADPTRYRDARGVVLPGLTQGNPDLSEETAKTWTAGIVLSPSFVPRLTLRADWYDIRLKQAINTADPATIAQLCVDQPSLANPFCAAIIRQNGTGGGAGPGNIVGFSVQPFNVSQFSTAGLDVALNYRLPTSRLGTFSLNVVGNYLDRLQGIETPGAETTDQRGERFAPKFSANADLSWTQGPVTVNYGLNWIDKTSRFTNRQMAGNPDIVDPKYRYLKQRWQHDLYVAVDVEQRLEVYAGANNLFDQKPELDTLIYPVSPVGRFLYAGFRMKLD